MGRKTGLQSSVLVGLLAFLNRALLGEAEARDVLKELDTLYGIWGNALKNKDLVAVEKLLDLKFTAERSGLIYDHQKATDELKSQLAGEDITSWDASIDDAKLKDNTASATDRTREFYTAAMPANSFIFSSRRLNRQKRT